jgi:hypothetical protein
MKSTLYAGAIALALWGGAAGAKPQTIDDDDVTVIDEETYVEKDVKKKPQIKERVHVMAGGGLEGYTGVLDNRLDTGFSWGATAGTQPFTWMGAELQYSGALSEVDSSFFPGDTGAANGADFVRNGGSFLLTFNAPTPYAQPYALGGIGFDDYNFRGPETPGLVFRDDTSGRIPVGGGVKTRWGALIADVRFQYNLLFSQQFARASDADDIGGDYTGLLQVGARF